MFNPFTQGNQTKSTTHKRMVVWHLWKGCDSRKLKWPSPGLSGHIKVREPSSTPQHISPAILPSFFRKAGHSSKTERDSGKWRLSWYPHIVLRLHFLPIFYEIIFPSVTSFTWICQSFHWSKDFGTDKGLEEKQMMGALFPLFQSPWDAHVDGFTLSVEHRGTLPGGLLTYMPQE